MSTPKPGPKEKNVCDAASTHTDASFNRLKSGRM